MGNEHSTEPKPASQLNSTRVSVFSASGAHHGTAEIAEPMASGNTILLLSTATQLHAQVSSTDLQTQTSDWKGPAKEDHKVRLESTAHQASMFKDINNIEISGGTFTIENHMASTICACDPTLID